MGCLLSFCFEARTIPGVSIASVLDQSVLFTGFLDCHLIFNYLTYFIGFFEDLAVPV